MDSLPDSTGTLPSAVIHQKRIPGRTSTNRPGRRSYKHIVRSTAKQLAQSDNPTLCRDLNHPCCWGSPSYILAGAGRRAHLENDLHIQAVHNALELAYKKPHHPRTRSRWDSDENEGRDLARSGVPLPSDHFRIVRRPSLEREEAFCDADTAKDTVRLRRNVNDDAEVAELYRLGLLYDDERDRGSGFDLNSIPHEEPVYPIRAAKRTRRSKRKESNQEKLYLNLSFADLGGDDAIARFLLFPLATESSDDGTLHSENSERSFAPLRVIYELDGSSPSIDVDTSQPPDLVSDILSDYDCFSDSDLDDLPSQREVRDSAATPASDAWVVLGDDS